MEKHYFSSPASAQRLSDAELQACAENYFVRPKTLQELPLILVPPHLHHLSELAYQRSPSVQAAINAWMQQARLEDERLRIERRLLPHTLVYLPDTPQGQQFLNLAHAIANIPLHTNVVPRNQDQGYWFKTLHYFRQALGIVIAQKRVGVIPDPLGETGVLARCLSEENLENLRLAAAIYIARFELLERGHHQIQQWAVREQRAYPFGTPFDLFLQILHQEFLDGWQLGPGSIDSYWICKAQQRKHLITQIECLRSWGKASRGNSALQQRQENEYRNYLAQAGWSGYWLLALQEIAYTKEIAPAWDTYVKAFSQGRSLFVNELDWRQGAAYQKRTTNNAQPVTGKIDLLGFIHWYWA